MSNIHLNPRKAKPKWLEFPCSVCEDWEEDERPIDPATKALWNNKKIPDGIRCKYNPVFCDVDDKNKCKYQHLLGKTIIGLYCDFCGKEFEYLKPDDPRLEELIKDPFHVDICQECKLKKDKELIQKRVVTILKNNKIITEGK